ncbi:restriction endonuclease [Candidatus Bathyarchaeota archaeon]|nr:restriction endonuclease [Candidatus Bathyarchaeota archaeon]
MSRKAKSDEEKRADLIIKYRNLKVESKEPEDQQITYHLSRGDETFILQVLLDQKTIGIAFVRELKDLVEKAEATKGILVGGGKYTYSAKANALKLQVELIPPSLPTFDLFEHQYVSPAELVSEEGKQALLEKYHSELFQFPWITVNDPVAIILGAEPGDVIKINLESQTAGLSVSYRYVV